MFLKLFFYIFRNRSLRYKVIAFPVIIAHANDLYRLLVSIVTCSWKYRLLRNQSTVRNANSDATRSGSHKTIVRYSPGSLLWATILNVRVKRVRDFQTNKSSSNRDRDDDQSKHFGTVIGQKIGCYALVSPPVFTYRSHEIIISINGISRTIPVPHALRRAYTFRIYFHPNPAKLLLTTDTYRLGTRVNSVSNLSSDHKSDSLSIP